MRPWMNTTCKCWWAWLHYMLFFLNMIPFELMTLFCWLVMFGIFLLLVSIHLKGYQRLSRIRYSYTPLFWTHKDSRCYFWREWEKEIERNFLLIIMTSSDDYDVQDSPSTSCHVRDVFTPKVKELQCKSYHYLSLSLSSEQHQQWMKLK